MKENKFLIIGYGNMGALHSEILFSLVDDCKFDIVDKKNKINWEAFKPN